MKKIKFDAVEGALDKFVADGSTDDTSNFTALRTAYPTTDFDLKGKTYRVTAIPEGPFHNGWFIIFGAGEGGMNVRYPAPGTYVADAGLITSGDRYSAWPQDSCHEYDGVLYSIWKEGEDHTGADVHTRMARSYDNGQTWEWFERLFQSSVGARSVFSAGTVAGRQLLLRREHNGSHSDGNIAFTQLAQRRLGERREQRLTPLGDFRNMAVSATAESSTLRVINCPRHGCRDGDKFTLTGDLATVGGLTLPGTYTVTSRGVDWFEYTHPNGPATSTETSVGDIILEFMEGNFINLNVRGVDFGTGKALSEALLDFPGTPYDASNKKFYFYSFCENPDDPSGGFWCNVVGGTPNKPYLIYITKVYVGSPYIAKVTKLSDYGGETSVKRLPDGTLFGFIRWGNKNGQAQFWTSSDDGDTIVLHTNGPKNGDFFGSPISCATDGEKIFAAGSGDRTRGPAKNNIAGDVPLYLIEGDAAEAVLSGWSAFTVTRIGSLYYANESWGDVGNAVGVGSLVYNKGILNIFQSTEKQQNVARPYGSPDIINLRIKIGEGVEAHARGVQEIYSHRGMTLKHRGVKERNEAGRFYGWGAAHLMGRVGSDGVPTSGHGFTATKTATGTYRVTLTKPLTVGENWHVIVTAEAGAPRLISAQPNSGGTYFDVFIGTSNTTLIDAAFRFVVFVDYQWTRTDWQGDT